MIHKGKWSNLAMTEIMHKCVAVLFYKQLQDYSVFSQGHIGIEYHSCCSVVCMKLEVLFCGLRSKNLTPRST